MPGGAGRSVTNKKILKAYGMAKPAPTHGAEAGGRLSCGSSDAGLWNLIRLDPGPGHDLAPAGGLVAHEGGEIFGAATLQVGALFGQVLADIGHLDNFREFRIEPLHDRPGRAAGHHDPVPERDIDCRIDRKSTRLNSRHGYI